MSIEMKKNNKKKKKSKSPKKTTKKNPTCTHKTGKTKVSPLVTFAGRVFCHSSKVVSNMHNDEDEDKSKQALINPQYDPNREISINNQRVDTNNTRQLRREWHA